MNQRGGFTLIEVIVAMVILAVVLLALATSTGGFVRTVSASDRQAAAIQLAEDRVAAIQMDPNYAGLGSYAATENTFATLPGMTRTTTVVTVGGTGQVVDHKRVTVVVSGGGLTAPVQRTITVAAP